MTDDGSTNLSHGKIPLMFLIEFDKGLIANISIRYSKFKDGFSYYFLNHDYFNF